MVSLTDIKHLIIDMDGVLWRGNEPLPGLQEFFAFLRECDIPFVLATNNSTSTPGQYVKKLASMAVNVSPDVIMTSGQATAGVAGFLSSSYVAWA